MGKYERDPSVMQMKGGGGDEEGGGVKRGAFGV